MLYCPHPKDKRNMRQVARIRMLLYTDYEKKHGKYLYVSSLEILKVIKIKLATLPYPSPIFPN